MVYLGNPETSPFHPVTVEPNEKKHKHSRRITICTENTKCMAIDTIAYYLDWSIVGENDLWNISWSDSANDVNNCHKMKRFQRINHFPSMLELSRKDLMSRNLSRMQHHFPAEYDFYPKTWIFPSDIPGAIQYAKEHKNTMFILKPGSGSCGNGIYLTKSLANVNPFQRMICQTYLKKPLLFDGFKFDLRVYTLITSIDPLRVYVYNEGLVRCATHRYEEPNEQNSHQKYMHLTNYSINKNSASYSRDQETGSKRTFAAFNRMLEQNGHDVQRLWAKIDDLIVKTIISAWPALSHSYRASFPLHDDLSACFELLGFDIIIDHNLNPFLLEVNHSPSFTMDEPIDRKVKMSVLRDTLKLLYTNVNDKRRVAREDRERIILRSLGKKVERHHSLGAGDAGCGRSESKRWQQNVQWEEKNLGDFRLVMPCHRRSALYANMFAANLRTSSVYSDTIVSKKRARDAKKKRKILCELDNIRKEISSPIQHRPSTITTQCAGRVKRSSRQRSESAPIKATSFARQRIKVIDENSRRGVWKEREKYIESFELLPLIYNQFSELDLLTKTDRTKYGKI